MERAVPGYKNREKDRKRKKSKLEKNQPSHKRPKEHKVTTYTIVLVEGMRDVTRGKYIKPDADKCVALNLQY
jgi:hypothetical protein